MEWFWVGPLLQIPKSQWVDNRAKNFKYFRELY